MTDLGTPEGAREYVGRVAAHRGWVVNPDPGLTDAVVSGLAAQAARLGKPYCPCRDVDGGPADRDVICPCAYAQADIDASGQCYCGLFLARSKDPSTVSSIPERRP